jgi:DNA polymerase-3 subunit delta'
MSTRSPSCISRRDGVSLPEATRAAREAQSHIGMAHRLATNEQARERRRRTLELALGIRSVSSAVLAAAELIAVATDDAKGVHRGARRRRARQGAALAGHRARRLRASRTARPAQGARRGPEAPGDPQPPRRDRPHPGRPDVAVPRHPAAAARVETEPVNLAIYAQLATAAGQSTPARTLETLDAIATARERIEGNVAPALALESMLISRSASRRPLGPHPRKDRAL